MTRRRKKPVSRYTAFARKGVPGEDYPVFTYIPQTDFDCGAQPGPGLYADPFTDCQVCIHSESFEVCLQFHLVDHDEGFEIESYK